MNESSAEGIYERCSEKLRSAEFSTRNLLLKMNVELVGTTDDPLDDLFHHQKIKKDGFSVAVLPSFRPDAAMNVDNTANFNQYLSKLQNIAAVDITTFADFLNALKGRHDYFALNGCKVSDHGLEEMYAEDYSDIEIAKIFDRIRSGFALTVMEMRKFKSAMLINFAEWNLEKGWIQQFHLGAIRNNNSRLSALLGADAGADSIGSFSHAKSLSAFLNKLDKDNKLAKTILYNLNPADNELMATMAGNFNDGTVAGKIQWGSAWWFLDQKDGMTKQINTLSNMGLISKFVGMITDSRSFLSYPRHEYFRRILCNLFGTEIKNGELPDDIEWTGKIIQDICYHNAKNYFEW